MRHILLKWNKLTKYSMSTYNNKTVEDTIQELQLRESKLSQMRGKIREEIQCLSEIRDIMISRESVQVVQKEIDGVKQFKDAAKRIPEMVEEKMPKVVESPIDLVGKKMTDARRLEIFNYHKGIIDPILLQTKDL